MSKEAYFKQLAELLHEYYNIIKNDGVISSERKHFIEGYMTAARTLNAIDRKELTDCLEKVHLEVFGMTVEERENTSNEKADLVKGDRHIPAYKRRGISLDF